MAWKEHEIAAMKRALALAARGRGSVEPNPMVGAVIVKNGRIIAEGYHKRFGGPHAEINALAAAGRRARGAEMFVTLEPCCHFGKTPPCTKALIEAGIVRVVVAMRDPFAKVAGKGAALLRKAGIAVETGLLGDEARALNAPYIRLQTTGLPYVIAKYAMTLDGDIATASGDSRWVSGEESRRRVHKLRGRVDAIITGVGTAIADDSVLTARPPGRRLATRVILDSRARLPIESKLIRTAREAPLVVAVTQAAPAARVRMLEKAGAEVLLCPVTPGGKGVNAAHLAAELGRRGMTNVLVEGGSKVLGSFFAAKLVSEVEAYIAPKLAGEGLSPVSGWGVGMMAEAVRLEEVSVRRSGRDVVINGRVVYGG
jgi:diaminohydroxyphosphoribosylaminopyrimidine deaminase/5-amino-6-(5-phosphoribosylamino)uracil reductase